MHTQSKLDRAYGFIPHHVLKRVTTSRLVYALQPSEVRFSKHPPSDEHPYEYIPAHVSGVNALTIDKFEGRYLLSGGADSSIAIWDLEAQTSRAAEPPCDRRILPMAVVNKTSKEHKLGITQVGFYPFDSLAFLTSSYDHTVKIYSSETLAPSATFDLDTVVYNIALSSIATHLLVACATQSPNVRLLDLRSGATTHSLAGHSGAVLSVAWSPIREHILVSGATDGSVRFWDIRRSIGELGLLDLEDPVGTFGKSAGLPRVTATRQAHRGPVNGIVWTEDGQHLVTCGHDQRVRVWDTGTAANTLANFGPMVRNSGLAPRLPVLPPVQYLQPDADIIFYPNEHEILGYELFDGKLFRRLQRTQDNTTHHTANAGLPEGSYNTKDRITSLAWRAHDVEMYSAHADGSIAAWRPRTDEDADLDEDEEQEREESEGLKKRKRGILDEIYQGLTKQRITFKGG